MLENEEKKQDKGLPCLTPCFVSDTCNSYVLQPKIQ